MEGLGGGCGMDVDVAGRGKYHDGIAWNECVEEFGVWLLGLFCLYCRVRGFEVSSVTMLKLL